MIINIRENSGHLLAFSGHSRYNGETIHLKENTVYAV